MVVMCITWMPYIQYIAGREAWMCFTHGSVNPVYDCLLCLLLIWCGGKWIGNQCQPRSYFLPLSFKGTVQWCCSSGVSQYSMMSLRVWECRCFCMTIPHKWFCTISCFWIDMAMSLHVNNTCFLVAKTVWANSVSQLYTLSLSPSLTVTPCPLLTSIPDSPFFSPPSCMNP